MPVSQTQRGTIVRAICAAALLCSLLPGTGAVAQSAAVDTAKLKPEDAGKADQAYLAGARLVERHQLEDAQLEFEKAAKLNPARREYAVAFELTRERRVSELVQRAAKARMTDQPYAANALLAEAKAIDPKNELVLEHAVDVQGLESKGAGKAVISPSHDEVFAAPIEAEPDTKPHDLHLRGAPKVVIGQAATIFGLKTAFDSSVDGETLPPVKLDLEQTTYAQAMPLLLKMSHLFSVSVDKKLLLIARDTQENRARLERQAEETIFVPASTSEELNELTNVIKNIFDVKQVAIAQSNGTISVRAPQATLNALNETVEGLIDGGSEVVMEVKLLTLDRDHSVNTGVSTPSSVGLFNAYGEASSIVSANQSLVQELISSGAYVPGSNAFENTIAEAVLLVISGAVQDAKISSLIGILGNGPLGLTGIYLGSGASVNFALNASDSRALDDISLRVGDRKEASLRVGNRYPIVTATFNNGISSATTSALAGININGQSAASLLSQYLNTAASATTPQVQYEDLGITLKATPGVLRTGMVNVKVDMKIEALTGQSLDSIPILTSRVFQSDITVPDGDSAVMMTDLSKTEAASISGLPGLGDLPGFQETLADRLKDVADSELVLVITPHVVRHRPNLLASRRIPFSTSVPAEF